MTEPFWKNLVVHRKNPHDVFVGRPSKWGNPFTHLYGIPGTTVVSSRLEAIREYRDWITSGAGRYLLLDLHELTGLTLGCFCAPMPCHGEVLAELANTKSQEIEYRKRWVKHSIESGKLKVPR